MVTPNGCCGNEAYRRALQQFAVAVCSCAHNECVGIAYNISVYGCAAAIYYLGIWLQNTMNKGNGTIYDYFHAETSKFLANIGIFYEKNVTFA
jgi:hypothetical protein